MYKTELITGHKLPKHLDRRRKLTPEKRAEIKRLYKNGVPLRKISRIVELDRNTISRVTNPKRYKTILRQRRERSADGRYKPTKEEWSATMREHREYKARALAKELKIKIKNR